MTQTVSALQKARAAYAPKLPTVLREGFGQVTLEKGAATTAARDADKIKNLFPNCYGQPVVTFANGKGSPQTASLNVGVVLSGGQAPGGHNVIAGLFDGLKALNADSRLLGYLGGPQGLIDDDYIDLDAAKVDEYRNTGGFDIIGSGRTKLETEDQFKQTLDTARRSNLSAIVVIGGDDSNTNACMLAEWLKAGAAGIQVIGVPKTIDGDLRNEQIEMSFGFDTAVKVYSELIGNICRDAASARKYWHFIKLMGRSASHITLEAELQTQANVAIISEEVAAKKLTLAQVVDQVADVIVARAKRAKNYGVALIPEGLVEFIPEIKALIKEINEILAKEADLFNSLKSGAERLQFVMTRVTPESAKCFSSLPVNIQEQLLLDRDAHGNVQVSRIETESLIVQMVSRRLKELKREGAYEGKFSSQTHFFGYEGRCAPPSNYDADYAYSLGFTAAGLVAFGLSGYISCVRNTFRPADQWVAAGVPLTMLMNIERRKGEDRPVIQKALTELKGKPFKSFECKRHEWGIEDRYLFPGPIQYFGPSEVCDAPTKTLVLERG
ncbi:MAG: diphosphate--fructose-6-phosphate 1-phosphotransferase [Candidatus Sumerlaeota bacterium]|nr:diphosphate--fructose-6-phosphate 1-phosphotransferase [Candidatus Sumerlaeota bacterium]